MNAGNHNVRPLAYQIKASHSKYRSMSRELRRYALQEMMSWASQSDSDGEWDFCVLPQPDAYAFFFSEEKDAIVFALKFARYL